MGRERGAHGHSVALTRLGAATSRTSSPPGLRPRVHRASRGGAFRCEAAIEHTTHVFLDAGGCVSLGALDRAIDESQLAIDRYGSLFTAASYPERRIERTSVARGALCVDIAKEPMLHVTRVFARSVLPCEERRFQNKSWWCGRGVRPNDHPYFAESRAHAATTSL